MKIMPNKNKRVALSKDETSKAVMHIIDDSYHSFFAITTNRDESRGAKQKRKILTTGER